MSITDDIKASVARHEGKSLFHLPPLFPGALTTRTMIVSEEIYDIVMPEYSKSWEGLRHSKLRGDLDAFTEGEEMSVAEKPFKKPGYTMIARVHPVTDEIWDLRNIDPNPGIRCLGAFGGKDIFIALIWDYREYFDWNEEIERCKSEWTKLFGSIPRFKGASLDEYLSNYYAV